MKDKLYRTNHKRAYYYTRRFAVGLSLIMAVSTAVVIPTYIHLHSSAVEPLTATETSEPEIEEENPLQIISFR